MVRVDETLAEEEMVMRDDGRWVPWRCPYIRSSDKSKIEGTQYGSREEVLIGIRCTSNKLECDC
jgi:hypothetical protein